MSLQSSALSLPSSSAKKTIHDVLPGSGLKPLARALLLLLDSYAWGAKDRCWPSVASLADQLEVSERTVQKYLAELKARGFISEVTSMNNKTGRQLMLLWKGEAFAPVIHQGVSEPKPVVHQGVSVKASPEDKEPREEKKHNTREGGEGKTIDRVVASSSPSFRIRLFDPDAPESPELQEEADEFPDWWEDGNQVEGPPPLSSLDDDEDLEEDWAKPDRDWLDGVFSRLDMERS